MPFTSLPPADPLLVLLLQYVYYGAMNDLQLKSFATRCGRLMKDYGPAVIDTFGQTGGVFGKPDNNPENTYKKLNLFNKAAAAAGTAPQMYISQPTGNIHYAYYQCNETRLDNWLPDGTPVVCTGSSSRFGGVFYVMGSMGGAELAKHVNSWAKNGTQ
eukprot:SAG31_NODE_21570_length_546_cov_0.807606_1_plen_157_part_10